MVRDVYSRRAKDSEFRARSAYKLIQIDNEFRLFTSEVERVIDLCAAPGSWSQVIAAKLGPPSGPVGPGPDSSSAPNSGPSPILVAVDLQEMAPIRGVHCLQGDITSPATLTRIDTLLGHCPADLVVCDGAPDVTGSHVIDEHLQLDLLYAAVRVCLVELKPGGNFVTKFFKDKHAHIFVEVLTLFFQEVYTHKPPSSRDQSMEAFAICKHLR
ncbi:ribosomal RNA methyltransferase [Gregarina niphandrodes]|uniref:Ribosomal RNA methyltransferase n=1 Tax=Gregarina niphandrodes TaxID=110365 RepID=A0A023AY56_GRENI|nr:ribosomal RNA methyltransferase [Gregarina niphandrodes]EZG43586.1 ribosomal RNA methyltransferase [Gregarina niphandrodes]|eukprot:XP_011133178.1 ribosomal RNA methyltransferase [Gregarina niphandrodes]